MELRRVLLLFAIVLGVAAIVASLSSSRGPRGRATVAPPAAETPNAPRRVRATILRFDADRAPSTRTLRARQAATISVASQVAGEVRIEGLGLSEVVEPATPALFDVYATSTGRHRVVIETARGVQARTAGVLVVAPAP